MTVFTLDIKEHEPLTDTLALLQDDRELLWVKPDPLLPPSHEHHPVRESARNIPLLQRLLAFFNLRKLGGAPCVFPLGTFSTPADNSPPCPFTEPWQWFAIDLLTLSGYGKLYADCTPEERAGAARCFTGMYGDNLAFCNPKSGFPSRNNYITGEMTGDDPAFDKIRGCGTSSIAGEIMQNDKGQEVVKVQTFKFHDGPPTGYGIEILADPRVQYATVIYSGGAVGNFPPRGLPLYTPIPYPLVSIGDIYYLTWYCQKYTGGRRPVGYKPD